MKNKTISAALLFSALTFLFVLPALAEETTDAIPVVAENPGIPAMSPEQAAMMAAWEKNTTVGEPHKALEPLVGNWKTTVRWWMKPDAPVEESVGTSENKWILDGRFVQENFKGTSMGKPFEGMGLLGYDNVRAQYQSVWLDNMSTGMMVSTEDYDIPSRIFRGEGSFSCPMTGDKEMTFRSESKVLDPNNRTFAMYTKTPEGVEFKSLEIIYERV